MLIERVHTLKAATKRARASSTARLASSERTQLCWSRPQSRAFRWIARFPRLLQSQCSPQVLCKGLRCNEPRKCRPQRARAFVRLDSASPLLVLVPPSGQLFACCAPTRLVHVAATLQLRLMDHDSSSLDPPIEALDRLSVVMEKGSVRRPSLRCSTTDNLCSLHHRPTVRCRSLLRARPNPTKMSRLLRRASGPSLRCVRASGS